MGRPALNIEVPCNLDCPPSPSSGSPGGLEQGGVLDGLSGDSASAATHKDCTEGAIDEVGPNLFGIADEFLGELGGCRNASSPIDKARDGKQSLGPLQHGPGATDATEKDLEISTPMRGDFIAKVEAEMRNLGVL